jgi:hypothetical protein
VSGKLISTPSPLVSLRQQYYERASAIAEALSCDAGYFRPFIPGGPHFTQRRKALMLFVGNFPPLVGQDALSLRFQNVGKGRMHSSESLAVLLTSLDTRHDCINSAGKG